MIMKSVYISDKNLKAWEEINRLAAAEKISLNEMLWRMWLDWLETNKRYKDAKITDFEMKEVLEVKREIQVYCKECGSYEVDDGGWVIHDLGCSSSRPFKENDIK